MLIIPARRALIPRGASVSGSSRNIEDGPLRCVRRDPSVHVLARVVRANVGSDCLSLALSGERGRLLTTLLPRQNRGAAPVQHPVATPSTPKSPNRVSIASSVP